MPICIRKSPFHFCVSRFARIWPTTVLSTLFVVFFIPSHLFLPFPDSAYSPVVVFFTHLVCVQSLIPLPSFYFGFNAVAWSISVELTFYIIFYFVRSWSFNSIISLLLSNITLALIGSLLLHFSHFASFRLQISILPHGKDSSTLTLLAGCRSFLWVFCSPNFYT